MPTGKFFNKVQSIASASGWPRARQVGGSMYLCDCYASEAELAVLLTAARLAPQETLMGLEEAERQLHCWRGYARCIDKPRWRSPVSKLLRG